MVLRRRYNYSDPAAEKPRFGGAEVFEKIGRASGTRTPNLLIARPVLIKRKPRRSGVPSIQALCVLPLLKDVNVNEGVLAVGAEAVCEYVLNWL